MQLDDLLETFDVIDDWYERYDYVISLGKKLPPLPFAEKIPENEVTGCLAKVWLSKHVEPGPPLRLVFLGDSDSVIVKGLIAIVFMICSNKTPQEILDADLEGAFTKLGLDNNLTANRRNGFYQMVIRIRKLAAEASSSS